MTVLKDKTGREVGRSCMQKDAPTPVVVEAKVAAPVVAAAVAVAAAVVTPVVLEAKVEAKVEPVAPPHDPEDDYMSCASYAGRKTDAKNSDVACFEHNGQHYFAIYDANGNVALRGEAHPTAAQRDEDLADVLRNRANKDRYETKKFGQKYQFTILRDENGKEIGRSCIDKIPVPAAAVDREDDYLTCNDYLGHARITNGSDFGTFKKDGLFYFAVYAKDGSVALRSEGHPTAELRDRDMKNVMDNRGKDANHTVITVKAGISYTVLKDDAGNEIGRSCLHKAVAAAAPVAPIAAAVAVAAVAAAATKIELPKVEIPKAVIPDVPAVDIPAATGGFDWRWLLPLLLLPLLWFMCKNCKETPKAVVVPPVKIEKPVVVEPAKTKMAVKSFLPVEIYFDNDQPDARTKATTTARTYQQAYDAYYPLRNEFGAKGDGAATVGFFDNEIGRAHV